LAKGAQRFPQHRAFVTHKIPKNPFTPALVFRFDGSLTDINQDDVPKLTEMIESQSAHEKTCIHVPDTIANGNI